VSSAKDYVSRLLATQVALGIVVIIVIAAAVGVTGVDDVGHEEEVLSLGHQVVTWRQDGEPEKVEHAQK